MTGTKFNSLGLLRSLLAVALLVQGASAYATESIVTGGKTGTYYAIGSNLRDIVWPALDVKSTKGSWANVEDMSRTRGVSLAIVQSDVYSAFVKLRDDPSVPSATRREYAQLLQNIRVFMPLYPEEIHFLVRKNDPIEFIHQIKGKRIWMDMEKSGTYLTALNIYSKMFGERPTIVKPFINETAIGDDVGTKMRRSALMALSNPDFYNAYPKVDVVVLVGGQPLGLLEKAVPQNLKLLKYDKSYAGSDAVLRDYNPAVIRKESYPALNMEGGDLPTLSVDSYLITAKFADPKRNQFVYELATKFCEKIGELKTRGHAKWNALAWNPGSNLPPVAAGWKYAESAIDGFGNCRGGGAPASTPVSACSPQDRFAGLCK